MPSLSQSCPPRSLLSAAGYTSSKSSEPLRASYAPSPPPRGALPPPSPSPHPYPPPSSRESSNSPGFPTRPLPLHPARSGQYGHRESWQKNPRSKNMKCPDSFAMIRGGHIDLSVL